jgi:transposase-like zinc-binding protein
MALQRAVYRPRDAEHTVLHQVIALHLEAFLGAAAEAGDGAGLPQFVEREFPFSCKGRAWCPSCGGRRMTERAAHLVDAVLPWVPVRQWVLTVPYRLRYQMAWNHGLSRAVLRVYTRVLFDVYARGVPGGRTGSVTVMQRAGSGLSVNLHFHTLVLDGVFSDGAGGALAFHPAPAPSDAKVAAALATIRYRVQRLLVRRGLEPADDATGPADRLADESPVLAGIVGASVQGRVALGAAGAPGRVRSARLRVGVGARSGGAGTPVSLCIAPALRAGAPAAAARRPRRAGAEEGVARRHAGAGVRAAGIPGTVGGDDAPAGNQPAHLPWRVGSARAVARARGRVRPEPTAAAAPLAAGLDDAGVKPTPRAWTWAALMHRAFAIDVLACPRCGGRLRLIATLHDPAVIRKILAHVGLGPSGPSPGPAPPAPGAAAP